MLVENLLHLSILRKLASFDKDTTSFPKLSLVTGSFDICIHFFVHWNSIILNIDEPKKYEKTH